MPAADNKRYGADPPRSHAIRPDVRPQRRTRWRHFCLKHMCDPAGTVYQISGISCLTANRKKAR